MECKFCNQPLAEGETLCPHCGKDNAEEILTTEEVVVEEPSVAETPVEEVPQPTEIKTGIQLTAGKLTAIIVATAVLVALLVALVFMGMGKPQSQPATTEPSEELMETMPMGTIPADGDPENVTCKGSYTVSDEEAKAQMDTVVATIGDYKLTNGDLQIYYWLQVQQFLGEYSYYASYIGLDYAQPLDTQICGIADGNLTWQQYFLDSALSTWQNYLALSTESLAQGYEIDATIRSDIDNIAQTLQETAVARGFETVEDYMAYNVGPGSSVENYTQYLEMYYQGYTYFEDLYNKMEPTQEELEAFFDAHAEDYAASGITKDTNTVDVRHVLIMPEGASSANIRTETFSDEAWAWAEAKAQELLDGWKAGEATEDTFAQLANENSSDSDGTDGGLYTGVTQGQMVETFDAWCFDEARQYGDVDIVKTEFGYHIMFFVKSDLSWIGYAESDFVGEKVQEQVTAITEKYPLTVQYDKIVLGLVKVG